MINCGRYRLFANSPTTYSTRAVDLMKRATVIDMLSDMDLDGYDDMPPEENKRLRAGYKGSYSFREKIDIEALDHPQRMFDLTEGLIRRKYIDKDIELILGGNFRRVLAQTWTV